MDNTIAETKTPEQTRLTISIAMATYNGAKYIREQLDSLAAQTLLPDELVITDDGSTDETIEIAKGFQSTATFNVKIFQNPQRLGWRMNFMKAMQLCSHEIIFFCDQDDVWYPNKIEIMIKEFSDIAVLMAFHKADLIDANGKAFGKFIHVDPFNPWQAPFGFLIAFRKSILIRDDLILLTYDCNNTGEVFAHDQWVTFLAACFGKIAKNDQVLAGYRQHANNAVGAGQDTITFSQRLKSCIKNRAQAFVVLKNTSNKNVQVLAEILGYSRLPTPWKARCNEMMLAFQDLTTFYDIRKDIYLKDKFFQRFLSFFQLLEAGAYSKTNFWSFGFRGLCRDVLLGVIFGPFISKYSSRTIYGDANCRRLC